MFERWCKMHDIDTSKTAGVVYLDDGTRERWDAWQEAWIEGRQNLVADMQRVARAAGLPSAMNFSDDKKETA